MCTIHNIQIMCQSRRPKVHWYKSVWLDTRCQAQLLIGRVGDGGKREVQISNWLRDECLTAKLQGSKRATKATEAAASLVKTVMSQGLKPGLD